MEKQYTWLMVSVASILTTITSCDKNERTYQRFEGRWTVTELTAGTTSYTKLPKWQLNACDNHEQHCTATWEHQNGSSATFYWRFTNMGGDFDFFADTMVSDTQSMAFSQCYNFSGQYDVVEDKRKRFRLESYATTGYPDVLVTILLEKIQ